MRTTINLLAAAATLLTANVARSQGRDLFQLQLGGGAIFVAKDHELYDRALGRRQSLDSLGPSITLGTAIFPLSWLGVGGESSFSPIHTGTGSSAELVRLRAHAIARLPYTISPYLLAGGGMIGILSSNNAVGHDMDPSLHWGGGLSFPALGPISVHLDARHIITAREGARAGNTNHFEAFAGISIGLFHLSAEERIDEAPRMYYGPTAAEPAPPPPPAPQPQPIAVNVEMNALDPCATHPDSPECTVDQIQGELDRVHFRWGLSQIDPQAMPHLDRIADILRVKAPDIRVEIAGHTDSTGPLRFNLGLSVRRAAAVKAQLMLRGVESARLSIRGYGEWLPVATNATRDGRAANRRSEVLVQTKSGERAELRRP